MNDQYLLNEGANFSFFIHQIVTDSKQIVKITLPLPVKSVC